MPPTFEVTVNGSDDPTLRYLTWTPVPAQLRVVDPDGADGDLAVTMRTEAGDGGRLAFRVEGSEDGAEDMTLSVPSTGEPVNLFLSGLFGAPSTTDGDCVLELVVDGVVVSRTPFMVRIRKNAESLSDVERAAFVGALAQLNNSGAGVFALFRAMHTEDSQLQAHGFDGFFPWHRAYLLDLERELQNINPAVALPYWQFDDPAPRLFSEDFLGAPDARGVARVSDINPLLSWTTDNGRIGIMRTPLFNPLTSGAGVFTHERQVVGSSSPYSTFRDAHEGDPHGSAHTSFLGDISLIHTAAKDPLFFLLHCNVDRLWAKWQWFHDRYDSSQQDTYFFRGRAGTASSTELGHNLLDTMWPWNNETGNGRPPTAPRHPFPTSSPVPGPPAEPIVRDMIDYQGHGGGAIVGFDYDDVPYESRG